MGLFRKTPYPVQWFYGLLSALLMPRFRPQIRKVVLTSFHGDGYRGNTRVIFEALMQHPDIDAVWLTRSPKLCEELRAKFGTKKVALQHSMRGLRELGEARAVFLTHGTSDYAFLKLPRHAAIIQTYHGLPTKRGEYLRPGTEAPPGWLHRKVLEYRFSPVTHFLSSSPVVSNIFSRRFGLPITCFKPTGYPMYEQLLRPGSGVSGLLPKLGITVHAAAPAPKIILYAPTYRRRSRTRWFPFDDFDAGKLDDFLREQNAWLCLRPHPNDRAVPPALLRASERILLTDQRKIEQTEALVSAASAIITDYSSIYLEGLLRDVAPVFIPYDKDSYERGLPMPYDEVTPGPKPDSFARLLGALHQALEGAGTYQAERERVKQLYFEYQSGEAAQRVICLLENEILN